MELLNVVVGIIIVDRKLLAFRRTKGSYAGFYELVGGKIEDGESHQMALIREMKEELCIDIKVGKFVDTIYFQYPEFNLCMHCYLVESYTGSITLTEHEDVKYLSCHELYDVEWLEATKLVINQLKDML